MPGTILLPSDALEVFRRPCCCFSASIKHQVRFRKTFTRRCFCFLASIKHSLRCRKINKHQKHSNIHIYIIRTKLFHSAMQGGSNCSSLQARLGPGGNSWCPWYIIRIGTLPQSWILLAERSQSVSHMIGPGPLINHNNSKSYVYFVMCLSLSSPDNS